MQSGWGDIGLSQPTTSKRTPSPESAHHQQTRDGEEEREPERYTNKTNSTTGHVVPEKGNALDLSHLQPAAIASPIHSILNWDPNSDPDPVNLWALRQYQMGNREPQFLSSSRAKVHDVNVRGMVWQSRVCTP